jgi:hypothetical protein
VRDKQHRIDPTEHGVNPYIQKRAPASNINGPFSVLDLAQLTTIFTCPFADVQGGNIMVTVQDSATSFAVGGAGIALVGALNADVEISGLVQGVRSIIKRAFVNNFSGPLIAQFETWDLYDDIEIRARNMTAGFAGPGGPSLGIQDTAAGARLSLSVTLAPAIERRRSYG